MGRPYLLNISGVAYSYYSETGNCFNPGGEVQGSEVPFAFTAPVTSSTIQAPDGKVHADFQYSACFCENSPNTTALGGLPACTPPGCGWRWDMIGGIVFYKYEAGVDREKLG